MLKFIIIAAAAIAFAFYAYPIFKSYGPEKTSGATSSKHTSTPASGGDGVAAATVTVYDGIKVPIDSTSLDLSGRNLSGSLKAEVRKLTALRELNLSHNQFTGLPAEVGQLRALEVLNLSYNPLTGLPHELGQLSNLHVLDLRGTNYSQQDLDVIKAQLPSSTQIRTDN